VAYLAGTDRQNLRADVRHLRDPNQSTGPAYDRFVILHYHFRSVTVGGVRMLGISQVNIRHGNQIRLTIRNGQLNSDNAGYVSWPDCSLLKIHASTNTGLTQTQQYRAQATQHVAAAAVLACEDNTAWCPVNGPPAQQNNNQYANLLTTATTTSNVQQIFNARVAPSRFLPRGVDWVNGNWPENIPRTGFSFDSQGNWYDPITRGYTTDNGFLSTRVFSPVNPGEN
jgi:hypothetical protein